MAQPIFNARDAEYRRPFGALTSGTVMEVTVKPPRIWGATRVVLVATIEGEQHNTIEIPLIWQRHELEQDVYTGALDTSSILGLVWYQFRIERGSKPPLYYPESPLQLTVYDGTKSMPNWYGKGLTYHIFVDRFAREGDIAPPMSHTPSIIPQCLLPSPDNLTPTCANIYAPREDNNHTAPRIMRNWGETPYFLPDAEGKIRNNDFFGGNLCGILSKLDYLEELGVETIFLSPIFEAESNHRYDTADYLTIDPLLGNEADFTALCAAADKRGIRIILDGVFNHTGYHSAYFNGRGLYSNQGAAQGEHSPYTDWYHINYETGTYDAWWGIYTLPKLNPNSKNLRDFFIENDNAVVKKWLQLGAAGWRLDVVDEIPDDMVQDIRRAAQSVRPDATIIGEVWEDASNKIAYSQRRRYFWGDELDGVMNYPLRDALIGFLLGGSARKFVNTIETLRENYPPFAFYNAMNALGTHDTPRILTILGCEPSDYALSKSEQAAKPLSAAQRAQAELRLKLGAMLLYCLPGSPCLYYGDEIGMEGFGDPLNRGCFNWNKTQNTTPASLLSFFKTLGQLRKKSRPLREGDLAFHNCGDDVVSFTRSIGDESVTVTIGRKHGEIHDCDKQIFCV